MSFKDTSDARRPLPKAGVGVLVFKYVDDKPYLMMHQRRGSLAKNYWGTGGGHLEVEESLMEAALRELHEEAGDAVVVKDVKFLNVLNLVDFKPKHFVDVSFSATWVSGEPTNNAPLETTDWQWFPLDELPEPLFPAVVSSLEAWKTGSVFFDGKFHD